VRASAHSLLLKKLRDRNPVNSWAIEGRCKFYGRWLVISGFALWLITFCIALESGGDPGPLNNHLLGLSVALMGGGALSTAVGVFIEAVRDIVAEVRASIVRDVTALQKELADLSYVDGMNAMESVSRRPAPRVSHRKARNR